MLTFTVTGFGKGGVVLRYTEETLDGARYLASKMADNGVGGVSIVDTSGAVIELTNGHRNSSEHWRAAYR